MSEPRDKVFERILQAYFQRFQKHDETFEAIDRYIEEKLSADSPTKAKLNGPVPFAVKNAYEKDLPSLKVFSIFRKDLEKSSKLKEIYSKCLKLLIPILEEIIKQAVITFFKELLVWISNIVLEAVKTYRPLPVYLFYDDIQDGSSKMRYTETVFQNWGRTVEKKPHMTFFPKTVEGLCSVVQMAKNNEMKIRNSGFRHSWTDLWADNEQIQISMLPLQITDHVNFDIEFEKTDDPLVPFHVVYYHNQWDDSEFMTIDDPQPEYLGEDGKVYANVRVGSGVFGLQILEWLFKRQSAGKKIYHLPLDVIMSLNTYGGTNGTMSHGSGLKHPTLSDLVVKIEYVDCNGAQRTIEDAELLQAAAGAIGMLGILTHITFKMEAATFASFYPTSVALKEAIPEIGDDSSNAFQQMVKDMNECFYCEYFWFYGQENVYKNTWMDDGASTNYKAPLIDKLEQEFQRGSSYLMGILQAVIVELLKEFNLEKLVKLMQSAIPKLANDALLLPETPLTILTFEGLHFRRGINYLPVKCMEFLIPIPKNDEGKADFSIFQKAWWDMLGLIKKYEDDNELSPMNLTMETRILDGSKIYLAPEYGNDCGTCSIEVLGTELVEYDAWETFKNETAKIWSSYKDKDGNPLNARLHWGKEFPENVGDVSCEVYVRNSHKDGFALFKPAITKIAQMHDFTITDMRSRFSNKFLNDIFGPLWETEK